MWENFFILVIFDTCDDVATYCIDNIYLYISIFFDVYLSIYSASTSIYLSFYSTSFYLSIRHLSIYLLDIYLSIYSTSIYISIRHLSIYLFDIYLSIYLSIRHLGNFLENNFWTPLRVCPSERFLDPPPILSILYMTKLVFI